MDEVKHTMGAVLGELLAAKNVVNDIKLTLWQYREVHGLTLHRPCLYLLV